jgi:hypothetical protein
MEQQTEIGATLFRSQQHPSLDPTKEKMNQILQTPKTKGKEAPQIACTRFFSLRFSHHPFETDGTRSWRFTAAAADVAPGGGAGAGITGAPALYLASSSSCFAAAAAHII